MADKNFSASDKNNLTHTDAAEFNSKNAQYIPPARVAPDSYENLSKPTRIIENPKNNIRRADPNSLSNKSKSDNNSDNQPASASNIRYTDNPNVDFSNKSKSKKKRRNKSKQRPSVPDSPLMPAQSGNSRKRKSQAEFSDMLKEYDESKSSALPAEADISDVFVLPQSINDKSEDNQETYTANADLIDELLSGLHNEDYLLSSDNQKSDKNEDTFDGNSKEYLEKLLSGEISEETPDNQPLEDDIEIEKNLTDKLIDSAQKDLSLLEHNDEETDDDIEVYDDFYDFEESGSILDKITALIFSGNRRDIKKATAMASDANPNDNKKIIKTGSDIQLKSTPDLDFFSPISETPSFISKIKSFILPDNKSSDPDNNTGERKHLEDYERSEDADYILSDIYDLKSTLAVRFAVLAVLGLLSTYLALANNFSLPIFDNFTISSSPYTYILTQTIFAVIALASSVTVIASGIKKLFMMRSDCDSLSALTSTGTFISAIAMLFDTSLLEKGYAHIFIPIGILSLMANALGKLMIVNRAAVNFGIVSSDKSKYGIMYIDNEERAENIARGAIGDYPVLAAMRKTSFLSDFLRYTYSSDIADKFCVYAVPIGLSVSLIISAVSAIFLDEVFAGAAVIGGFSVFGMCLGVMGCFAMPIVVNLPLLDAANELVANDCAILGYQSIDDFYDANSIMIDVSKLFPEKSIQLSGIKIFSDTKIDDAIIEAASLAAHAGSVLYPMFNEMIVGKKELLHKVENYSYEESAGICGWIDNRRVLLGNRQLMNNHNIEGLPSKLRENEFIEKGKEVVYLSISGSLSAMFVVVLTADNEVKNKIYDLAENNVKIMVRSVDSIISSAKLSDIFEVSEETLSIIPHRVHSDYEKETEYKPRLSASMACTGKFTSMARLITASKSIRKCSLTGLAIQSASAIIGIILLIILEAVGDIAEITPSLVIFYNLIWSAITTFFVRFGFTD